MENAYREDFQYVSAQFQRWVRVSGPNLHGDGPSSGSLESKACFEAALKNALCFADAIKPLLLSLKMARELPVHHSFERHVVLVAPDIHWNTGNIGRTCLGINATLHLIEPLGFSLDSRCVKRAGLDYWGHVKPHLWRDFNALEEKMSLKKEEVCLFTKKGLKPYWSMPDIERLFLVFGSETRGLPDFIITKYAQNTFYIPINREIRSLNLSTAVGIILYESIRNIGFQHCWSPP